MADSSGQTEWERHVEAEKEREKRILAIEAAERRYVRYRTRLLSLSAGTALLWALMDNMQGLASGGAVLSALLGSVPDAFFRMFVTFIPSAIAIGLWGAARDEIQKRKRAE